MPGYYFTIQAFFSIQNKIYTHQNHFGEYDWHIGMGIKFRFMFLSLHDAHTQLSLSDKPVVQFQRKM